METYIIKGSGVEDHEFDCRIMLNIVSDFLMKCLFNKGYIVSSPTIIDSGHLQISETEFGWDIPCILLFEGPGDCPAGKLWSFIHIMGDLVDSPIVWFDYHRDNLIVHTIDDGIRYSICVSMIKYDSDGGMSLLTMGEDDEPTWLPFMDKSILMKLDVIREHHGGDIMSFIDDCFTSKDHEGDRGYRDFIVIVEEEYSRIMFSDGYE